MPWEDGIFFIARNDVPRGEPWIREDGQVWVVNPYDLLQQQLRGKLPLYTRHTLGAIEAERDRRKYKR